MTKREFINKLSDWEEGKICMEDLLIAGEQYYRSLNAAKPIVKCQLPPSGCLKNILSTLFDCHSNMVLGNGEESNRLVLKSIADLDNAIGGNCT